MMIMIATTAKIITGTAVASKTKPGKSMMIRIGIPITSVSIAMAAKDIAVIAERMIRILIRTS